MAKKLLRNQQEEARKILKQIFNLALAINSNCTQKETTGEKPTVFVNLSGHIAGVEVTIYPTGWDYDPYEEDDAPVIRYTIYFDDVSFTVWVDEYEPYPEEEECEGLTKAKAALAELKRIAEEWGVEHV